MEVLRTEQLERIIRLYGRTYREGYDELMGVETAVRADIARCRAQLPPEAFEPQVEPLLGAVEREVLARNANLAVLRALGKPTHRTWHAQAPSPGGGSISGADINFGDVPPEAYELIDRFVADLGSLTKPAAVFPEKRHPLSEELTPAVLAYFETACNSSYGRTPLDADIPPAILNKFELMSTVLNGHQTLECFELGNSGITPCLFQTAIEPNPLRIERGIVMVQDLCINGYVFFKPFTC